MWRLCLFGFAVAVVLVFAGTSRGTASSPEYSFRAFLPSLSKDSEAGAPLANTPAASYLTYDVGPRVPAEDLAQIKRGIALAQSLLSSAGAGDIAPDVQRSITVKVVADGRGNQEPGGGGACCTAFSAGRIRPFFDVRHPAWDSRAPGQNGEQHHVGTAAHEYGHGWQRYLGCISDNEDPMGWWYDEGVANYIARETLARSGLMTREQWDAIQIHNALYTGGAAAPLERYESSNLLWPGYMGSLAITNLAERSSIGFRAIRVACEEVAHGHDVDQAFKAAFGITRTAFYKERETFRLGLVPDPRVISGTFSAPAAGYAVQACTHGTETWRCYATLPLPADGPFDIRVGRGLYTLNVLGPGGSWLGRVTTAGGLDVSGLQPFLVVSVEESDASGLKVSYR